MEEDCNKEFKDFHQVAKGKEPHKPKWDSLIVEEVELCNKIWYQ